MDIKMSISGYQVFSVILDIFRIWRLDIKKKKKKKKN